MSVRKIVIQGTRQVTASFSTEDPLQQTDTILLSGSNRAAGDRHEINLKKDDVLEMVFNDDTTWLCNSDTIEDVFPEASTTNRSGNTSFVLPNSLSGTDENRGVIGDVLLKAVNIFSKKKLTKEIRELAADLEKKQLDNLSGLYQVDQHFNLQPFTATLSEKPWLVFLHGTGSSAKGSFGELLNTPLWNFMQQQYAGQVLAFQHETLTKSPLQNIEDLLGQLPRQAELHLVSHSRGGLLGDVLARFCNGSEMNRGFDKNEIALLQKEKRTTDLNNIEAINAAMTSKRITVSKFIRVACPASGTTLASGRMDNFFNVSLNLLGLATGMAANPVYISFRALTSAVINCKNDVDTLPGLEAMNPDSPFIKVLNNLSSRVILDNPLAIIAGNCKTKLNFKALLIIASRIFFQKNNDLVVNTAAMYRGAQRVSQVQYFLDADTNVDHFHYFKNQDTQTAMLNALKAAGDTAIPGFQVLMKGDASLDRNALLKLDGGQVFPVSVSGTRPIVLLLPGIMGSNLTADDKLVWINYLRFLGGELKKIDIKSNEIEAPSIVRSSYAKLVKQLSASYDVVVFPFDWRLQLNESAKKLKEKIEELLAFKQPIKLIGHSMGGVLVRDFMVTQQATWKKLNSSAGFRLLFLGSPLGGSFRIPFVLFGKDPIIDKISKLDIFHSKKELLAIFGKFPGLLSLLPYSTDSANDFGLLQTWQSMSAAHGDNDWPLPSVSDLKAFADYRNQVLKNMNEADYENAVYVAGKDKATPCGYRIDDTTTGKQLSFLSTAEGDQSVTWETGIPKKMIASNTVYYVNVSHGALANDPGMFKGIEDILSSGSTTQFSRTRPVVRGAEKLFKTPDLDDHDLSPEALENTILGLTGLETPQMPQIELAVSVANGDLRYASYPLITGHFLNDGITSAEWQVNKNLNYALSDRHMLGIYPGEIGSSEIFVGDADGFKGALIVGLGTLHAFTAYELTQTVQQGVSKYLLDLKGDDRGSEGKIGLSSLLVGSGYGGLSIENAIRAILQGVQNANAKVSKLKEGAGRIIEHLEFVELYEDNALNCFYALRRVAAEDDQLLRVNVPDKIENILGKRKRIIMRSGENWWNRISVRQSDNFAATKSRNCFVFSASTGAARDLERNIYINPSLLKEILDDISTHNNWNRELAKTIFELLIPNDFKEQLKRRSNANWILDAETAAYPWELLQDSISEARPLCVNAGMIRQLSERDSSFRINTVAANNALVVGDPFLDGFITQLPGAYAEAELVAGIFKDQQFETTNSLKEKSSQIIKKMFSNDYKIIHLAGHGLFDADNPQASGMVIGKDVYLTTAEIAQMSAVPEFIFVNCCFLGKTDAAAEALYRQRYKLAANIGIQLIKNGVRAVIVAGWAVDDTAALEFAKQFYNNMFEGDNFGDAVRQARRCCYEKFGEHNNTWGAYQCYGDPFYQFDIRASSAATKEKYVVPEEAEIDLANLRNSMQMGTEADEKVLARLIAISSEVDECGIRNAAITEREAFVYADLAMNEEAVNRFNDLLVMEDAAFYVSTLEVFCNCKAKKTLSDFLAKKIKAADAIHSIEQVVKELENLLYISPTAERFNLLGSTHKRRAMLSGGNATSKKALGLAAWYYRTAYEKAGPNSRIYSLTNWIILESLLVMMGDRKWNDNIRTAGEPYQLPTSREAAQLLESARDEVATRKTNSSTYDQQILLANIRLCQLMLEPKNAKQPEWDQLLLQYRKTWARVGSDARKRAEIEQLDILNIALDASEIPAAISQNKKLRQLKEGLLKMLD
ncbi:MAG: CHAT domain-containing protein [Chitinophagaceae bacterium]|nr:MAG: CHAT domain-containing protein [Chitinophagaceae bacterium]